MRREKILYFGKMMSMEMNFAQYLPYTLSVVKFCLYLHVSKSRGVWWKLFFFFEYSIVKFLHWLLHLLVLCKFLSCPFCYEILPLYDFFPQEVKGNGNFPFSSRLSPMDSSALTGSEGASASCLRFNSKGTQELKFHFIPYPCHHNNVIHTCRTTKKAFQ